MINCSEKRLSALFISKKVLFSYVFKIRMIVIIIEKNCRDVKGLPLFLHDYYGLVKNSLYFVVKNESTLPECSHLALLVFHQC
jgi:hypothetical protein